MSYSVHGIAYHTRNDALTALIAVYVSADGLNDLDTITSALRHDADTAAEMVRDLNDGFDGVSLGQHEEPAYENEIRNHIITHSADIIGATP
ncbi:MAG TPA: hypothetical protein DCS18_16300 [Alcanivorax sp.]|mgnify:FL=1|jgi:hypothetical protein|nr:hypothetical protein [Alcanivorax sp.]HAV68707.1 hypothetical protein [Alcanivorax sp.]|tara:strand:- start:62271 stop:62546 length:276 start_codon:yes stop_codon:yes gene_type:complete